MPPFGGEKGIIAPGYYSRKYSIQLQAKEREQSTITPILSSPLWSGHPLLSRRIQPGCRLPNTGHFILFYVSTKWSPKLAELQCKQSMPTFFKELITHKLYSRNTYPKVGNYLPNWVQPGVGNHSGKYVFLIKEW